MTSKYVIPNYNLNWSKGIVYGPDINRSIVDEKYELFDKASSRGLIGVDIDATAMLEDDTIYAYAFLQWENQPIKLRYYQDAIMSDNNRKIDVEAANQQGKTFSLCVKAAVNFLKDHGKNFTIGLISKSMGQNSSNMRMTRAMLKEAKLNYTPGSNDNMTVMVHDLGNGIKNTLVCSVASTSALGYPFDLLLLDEFEFWENPEGLEYMYDQVLEPRTFHTRGQIIIYSNPNGKNFVSENLHKRTLNNGDLEFHVYNINFLDNPHNTQEEWDKAKRVKHPIFFASTMAALRTESEGAALTAKDIERCKDEDVNTLGFYGINPDMSWWFADLGFVKDQTVLAGCFKTKNEQGETVYNFAIKTYPVAYPMPQIWGIQEGEEESLPQFVNRFSNGNHVFELDLTGKEGNEVLASQNGLSCSGIKMSGPWKAKWYDRFISLVKQGRIKVQYIDNFMDGDNKNFDFQARSLRISTKMADGRTRPYPLYHHTTEDDQDDILDAIVGCLSIADEDMDNFAGAVFIDHAELNEKAAEEKKKEQKKQEFEEPYDEEIEFAAEQGYRDYYSFY